MPGFEPLAKEKTKNEKSIDNENVNLEVQKAKNEAEIQKYNTDKVKSKQEQIFAENNLKDVDHLKLKIEEIAKMESELGKEKYNFNNQKATELSEIQKKNAELDRKNIELNQRARDIASREVNVEVREKLIEEREELLNTIEKKNLKDTENYNSIQSKLSRTFPQIIDLLKLNANILIKARFGSMGNGIWDEIDQMEEWHNNGFEEYTETIIEWMRGEVDDCNKKAILMYDNPKQYGDRMHNKIIDNLEKIYKLLPVLKPSYLPKDEE